MSAEELETVNAFLAAIDEERDYEKAAEFLADDFKLTSPNKALNSKQEWLKEFPQIHKSGPAFESPEIDAAQGKVVRNGKAKKGFVTVKVQATYHFDGDGKIEHIATVKA